MHGKLKFIKFLLFLLFNVLNLCSSNNKANLDYLPWAFFKYLRSIPPTGCFAKTKAEL